MPSLSSSISSCSTFSSSGMTPDHFRHRHSQSDDHQVMIHERYVHNNKTQLERSRSTGSNYYYYPRIRQNNNNHITLPLSKSRSCPCSPASSSSSSSFSYPKSYYYYYNNNKEKKQRHQQKQQHDQKQPKDNNKSRRVSFNQQVIVIEPTLLPSTETSPPLLSALIDEGDTKKNDHCLIKRTEEITNEYAGDEEEQNAKKNKWLWDESQLAVELADDIIYEQNNSKTVAWYKRIIHNDQHYRKKKLSLPRFNNMRRHRSCKSNTTTTTTTNQKQQQKKKNNNKWWSRRTPAELDVPVTPLKPTTGDFYNNKNNNNRHHPHAILVSATTHTQYNVSSCNNSITEDKQSKQQKLNKKPCIQKFTRPFKKLMMGFVI
ncbi:hypothetical protein INT45_002029 [Circinella minor]|uniref:Uncharacterized protein n=1 Tax=Circinella minor TaxID=1195481 RepID=A0A8H7SGH6_9FUNG|nr:hypothetical protein INT45_002029 [Circinella minor]